MLFVLVNAKMVTQRTYGVKTESFILFDLNIGQALTNALISWEEAR